MTPSKTLEYRKLWTHYTNVRIDGDVDAANKMLNTNLELACGLEHCKHALSSAHCMVPVMIGHVVPVATFHSQHPLAKALSKGEM